MLYISKLDQIEPLLPLIQTQSILWMDTEIADWRSSNPRLSLIQIAIHSQWDEVLVIDVLDQPDLSSILIQTVMINPTIEKVFHNAGFDKRYLGGSKAQNVTCTLQMAKKLKHRLPVPDLKLKTLAECLCPEIRIDKSEQRSDWGKRPLSAEQLEYAANDCIALAKIHTQLKQLNLDTFSGAEQFEDLAQAYLEAHTREADLKKQLEQLKKDLKSQMQSLNVCETDEFRLIPTEKRTVKLSLSQLIKASSLLPETDFPINLSKQLEEQLQPVIKNKKLEIREEDPHFSIRLNQKT
jgi:ribonuclease D